MKSPMLKLAGVLFGSICTLVFAVPYGAAESTPSATCAAAKAAALVAQQDLDSADFRHWQVEVKRRCLAAVGIEAGGASDS